jgi:hypothetical protein
MRISYVEKQHYGDIRYTIDDIRKEGAAMEQRDLELIQKHIITDHQLRKLYEEHLDLENRLEAINQMAYLTPEEELKKKNLKKVKLKGRDEIERILRKYREFDKIS